MTEVISLHAQTENDIAREGNIFLALQQLTQETLDTKSSHLLLHFSTLLTLWHGAG